MTKNLIKFNDNNIKEERYLNQIVMDMNIKFQSNNLIIAPAGSGKTTLINDLIVGSISAPEYEKGKKFLILVSTRTLLDSYGSKLGITTEEEAEQATFTSADYDVITYAKYGNKVMFDDLFLDNYLDIFCDEIHSLFDYFSMSKSLGKVAIGAAIKSLMQKYESRKIYYFTATAEKMEEFALTYKSIMRNVTKYPFDEVADIKRQKTNKARGYRTIEQAIFMLKDYAEMIKKGEMKVLIYTRFVEREKYIKDLLLSQNALIDDVDDVIPTYRPVCIWSKKNPKAENKFTEEQEEAYESLMKKGQLVEPHNILVINPGAREGWDLLDDKFTIAIIDTEDGTDFIQSLGRIRQNVEEIFYLDKDAEPMFKIMDALIDLPISTEDRDILIEQVGLTNSKGKIMGWSEANKIFKAHGYNFKKKVETVNKERMVRWLITK